MHDSLSESGSSQTLFASRASEFSYPDCLATLGYCHVVTSRVPPVIWKWALSFTQDKGSQMLLDTVQAEGPGPCFANMLPHLGICFGLCLGWEADRFISFINTGKIKASQRLIFRLKAFFLGQRGGGMCTFLFPSVMPFVLWPMFADLLSVFHNTFKRNKEGSHRGNRNRTKW